MALLAIGATACDDREDGEGTGETATPAGSTVTPAVTASQDEQDADTPAITATPTATRPGSPPPAGPEETGVEAIDDLIADVLAANIEALVDRAQTMRLGCTTAQGAGGPPKCGEGEVEGDEVEVFPFAACEGEYIRVEDLDEMFRRQFIDSAPRLYAVFELADEGTVEFPRGTHGVLFEVTEGRGQGRLGVVVGTNEGGDIVSLVRGCNLPLEQLYDDERDPEGDVLVEPTG